MNDFGRAYNILQHMGSISFYNNLSTTEISLTTVDIITLPNLLLLYGASMHINHKGSYKLLYLYQRR